VGVNFANYSEAVGSAQSESNRLPAVPAECTTGVVEPLNEAMTIYAEQLTSWNSCIQSDYCTQPSGLSEAWADASARIAAATTYLDETSPVT
jgi:hypothetical protein